MALILHLETTTPTCSVALSENGKLLAVEEQTASNIHARVITRFIETVTERAGRPLEALDAVCVSKGPGSYTGLRIGVSTAKGLCYALDKPLIAVGTLEAMAAGFASHHGVPPATLLCPALDARRMEIYMGIYRSGPGGHGPDSATLTEVVPPRAQIMDEQSLDPWAEKNELILFGPGAEKCQPLFGKNAAVTVLEGFIPSAAFLMETAERMYSAAQFEDVAYFEPYYLKDFVATGGHR